jgi:hypothetical protein
LSVQNSKGGGDDGDSCADPCQEFQKGFLGVLNVSITRFSSHAKCWLGRKGYLFEHVEGGILPVLVGSRQPSDT